MADFKIGDRVWIFDDNHRVYDRSQGGGPIYEKHFIQRTITGETRQSWILNDDTKVLKRNAHFNIYDDQSKADKIWAHLNRYHIIREIQTCPVEQLRQIAAIVGYQERESK